MQDNIKKISALMNRMYLTEPVSVDVQSHICRIKRAQFNRILKRAGAYSIAFGLVSYLFFSLKKIGIGITIYKSAVVAAAASAIAAAGIGAGAYKAYEQVVKTVDKTENVIPSEIKTRDEAGNKRKTRSAVRNIDIQKVIGVQEFTAEGVDAGLSRTVFNKINRELGSLRGTDYTIDISKAGNGSAGMALKGSVEFFNGIYNISVKLINVKNLKILYYNAMKVNSIKEIDSACSKLSREIAEKFPVKGENEK